MNRAAFLQFVEDRGYVFLDGATGTNLQKAGMPSGVCPEVWMLEHPDVIGALKQGYIDAGTQILYAPTFGGNRVKLEEYGYGDRVEEINTRLLQLAKEQAGAGVLIAGDMTMTGRQLQPVGDMPFEQLISVYKEQISILERAGADLLIVETMMSLQECRAALIAAKEVSDIAVMVTLTFEEDGRTLFGNDPAACAVTLEALGACAVGANCSTGPDKMAEVIEKMASVTSIPVIAKPNAGLPKVDEAGLSYYDMGPEEFAEGMELLASKGARVLGGCCGTTPMHIKAMVERMKGKAPHPVPYEDGVRYLSSERQLLAFQEGDPFLVVGERINPTGKKRLQEELRAGNLEYVTELAEAQEADGAAILDVNAGMSGIDEKEMLTRIIEEVTQVTSLPLCIDTSDVDAMEAALRIYPGRALINSISLEPGKAEKMLPLAKKYGAMFILLPVGPEGLPKSLEEKHAFIETLTEMAFQEGLTMEDIVVDGLVATVAADKEAAKNVLATIRHCTDKGYATIGGLSNISFGLPGRSFVNAAFLSMAIAEGLTMAIANPSQGLLMNTARAADLLRNRHEADEAYISQIARYEEREAEKAAAGPSTGSGTAVKGSGTAGKGSGTEERGRVPSKDPTQNETTGVSTGSETAGQGKDSSPTLGMTDSPALNVIYKDVLSGKRRTIVDDTKAALAAGHSAKEILDSSLMPAIEEVGKLFDKGKYFLPQLIAGAEAMKLAIAHLEPLLQEEKKSDAPPVTIIIATVHGDIHDIGKNLVTLMLKNYGFNVIDMGKDVPTSDIIAKAKEVDADIIALSALMTTTMQEMQHVVELAKKENVRAKIMIGGAVVTQDYADEIHADAYSADAQEAVKVAQKILSMI